MAANRELDRLITVFVEPRRDVPFEFRLIAVKLNGTAVIYKPLHYHGARFHPFGLLPPLRLHRAFVFDNRGRRLNSVGCAADLGLAKR